MLHHAQSSSRYVLYNACEADKSEFKKQVECVSIADVTLGANIIASHTIYKIKIDETSSLRLKTGVAPHGSKGSLKNMMKADFDMCAPVGFCIISTIWSNWTVAMDRS